MDDAVQEAWLRLNRSDPSAVENLARRLLPGSSRAAPDAERLDEIDLVLLDD